MGAWIETNLYVLMILIRLSRSLVGAWIETVSWKRLLRFLTVAPLWERGLKHLSLYRQDWIIGRSLVGAWIET